MITAKDFIDLIFEGLDDDEFVCLSRATPKKDGSGMWFTNYLTTARQWRRWEPERQAQAWYFCVSTIDGDLNDKGTMPRRGRDNLKHYYCLVLDDIGTKASPPPVEPNWKIETSPNNWQWGYLVTRGSDWPRYEALVEFCHSKEWGDAGAGGSYRLMRLPGSANLKPGKQEFRSHIPAEIDPEEWTLDELADALGTDLDTLPVKQLDVSAKTAGAPSLEGIDPMLDWLSDAAMIIKDDGGEWVSIICPWADAHTTGDTAAGYSPLGRGKGEWVQRRAFKCLHEHCVDKRLNDLIKLEGAPFVSGYDPLPWLQSKFCYVQMTEQVADLDQRVIGGEWTWPYKAWANSYSGMVRVPGRDKPVSVGLAFRESVQTKTAINLKYVPVRRAADIGIVTKLGQEFVNTYVSPDWEPTNESPQIFLDHMDYLIPDPHARELFLNWLAHKAQNPMLRSWAVLMISEGFGTGRSWLKRLLTRVYRGNVSPVTLGQLIGKGTSAEKNYNDWQIGSLYLVCDEVKDGSISREDFWTGYETFKSNVDISVNENVRINTKYGAIRNEDAYYNVLMFSNHADALALPVDERRIYVIENPSERLDADYYDRLTASLDGDEPRRVYWWLMRRDLTGFGHIYPEDSAPKSNMIESTRAPSDRVFDWLVEYHGADLVTRNSLRLGMRAAAQDLDYEKILREPSEALRRIWTKIKSLRPGDKNGARYSVNGSQVEVRAIRNRLKWMAVDDARDKTAFEDELGRVADSKNVVNLGM